MKSREVIARLRELGCTERQGKGSHRRFVSGACATTVPVHKGKDLKSGTLRGIEKDMEPSLGEGWLTGRPEKGDG
jgi:predicted RNA binding protein YcfA (HicA-like mRNA interferase family)